MLRSLGESIEALERAGELRRIAEPASPALDIGALADLASDSQAPRPPSEDALRFDPRHAHLGGPALLFENVQGSALPVLINAYGSYSRMALLLGTRRFETPGGPTGLEAVAQRIAELTRPEPPRGLRGLVAAGRRFAPLLRAPPRRTRRAPCQEVVLAGDDVDLTLLPLLRCWPLDGDLEAVGFDPSINDAARSDDLLDDPAWRGRYITFAHMHTIHPDDAGKPAPPSHNMGMYRAQLVGRRTLAMHWHMHHDGARHFRAWRERGERMPICIAFGGESALPFAAVAPLPPGLSELLFAGFLGGRGVALCRCSAVPLWAPANAEIVIEGWVDTRCGDPGFDPRTGEPLGEGAFFEGPFGDHTGFYSLPDRYPLVEVSAITMRRDAVFPATIVGKPLQEDYFLGKAVERIFLPLLRTIAPDILDYDLPVFGAFHNCAILQIRKAYPLQARRLAHAVWGAGQMAWTKCVIVVDEEVDPHDHWAVLRAVAQRCRLDRDVERVSGPLDVLDHAAPFLGAGGKIAFDATRPIAGEEAPGPWKAQRLDARTSARALSQRLQVKQRAPEVLGGGWLFLQVQSSEQARTALAQELARPASRARLVVALGPEADLENTDDCLFHFLANMDPARDALWSADGLRMGFDAAPKRAGETIRGLPVRDWPPMQTMDDAVRRKAAQLLQQLR